MKLYFDSWYGPLPKIGLVSTTFLDKELKANVMASVAAANAAGDSRVHNILMDGDFDLSQVGCDGHPNTILQNEMMESCVDQIRSLIQ